MDRANDNGSRAFWRSLRELLPVECCLTQPHECGVLFSEVVVRVFKHPHEHGVERILGYAFE